MKKNWAATILLVVAAALYADPTKGQSRTDQTALITKTSFDGPALQFDFPGVEIGVAEYDEGPTGTTVFYFPKRATGVVDVRGGWPGTVNTDGLRLGYDETSLDAVTFAGGSYYGLSVFGGVADEIRRIRETSAAPGATPGRGNSLTPAHVVSAIVFDLGRRFNTIAPDAELGRAAFKSRRAGYFPLGARGAGRMTGQGGAFGEREKGGQGAAIRQAGATKVMVFAVLNGGAVVDRAGNVVVCNHPASSGVGPSAADHFRNLLLPSPTTAVFPDADEIETAGFSRATNLFLVVTNQKMSWANLQRLAVQVHTSLGRAIQPFNTRGDGDTLYAVSTQEVENPSLSAGNLNLHATEAAWDAVLAALPQRPARATNRPVSVSTATLNQYVGDYQFGDNANAVLQITLAGPNLAARSAAALQIYEFSRTEDAPLLAESDGVFYQQNTRWEDRLQFVKDNSGRVTGLILNPGLHHIHARRVR
jgi:L-aminopeptidase/D-esterase-like protein